MENDNQTCRLCHEKPIKIIGLGVCARCYEKITYTLRSHGIQIKLTPKQIWSKYQEIIRAEQDFDSL